MTSLAYAQTMWKAFAKKARGEFANRLSKMAITSAGGGKVQFEFKLTEELTNMSAGIFPAVADIASGATVLAAEKPVGVTVQLELNYIANPKIGDVILLNTDIQKIGKSLAFVNFNFVSKQDEQILIMGKSILTVMNSDKGPVKTIHI